MRQLRLLAVLLPVLLTTVLSQAGPGGISGVGTGRPLPAPGATQQQQSTPGEPESQAGETRGTADNNSPGKPPKAESRALAPTPLIAAERESSELQQKTAMAGRAARKIRKGLTAHERHEFNAISRQVVKAVTDPGARQRLQPKWKAWVKSRVNTKGSPDIDTLVQAVMYEAWRQQEQQLKQMLDEMHELNEAKSRVRRELARAREYRNKTTSQTAELAYRPARITGIKAPATVKTRPQMDTLIDELDSKLAKMGSNNEELMLKLQVQMDRKDQAEKVLSNIMKAFENTARDLVANIK